METKKSRVNMNMDWPKNNLRTVRKWCMMRDNFLWQWFSPLFPNWGISKVVAHRKWEQGWGRHMMTERHELSCSGSCTLAMHPPFPYIRHTLGCGRRKQGLSPCIEPSPSLSLNHAAHNGSRQWAILNYSGAENIAALKGAGLCSLETRAK